MAAAIRLFPAPDAPQSPATVPRSVTRSSSASTVSGGASIGESTASNEREPVCLGRHAARLKAGLGLWACDGDVEKGDERDETDQRDNDGPAEVQHMAQDCDARPCAI